MISKNSRIISACLIGNLLEWFDFAVYGFLAIYIAPLFFPSTDKIASLLMTYSIFAVGFFVRPLSAVLFGYIGDRYGRRRALYLSCLLMAIPTCIMGLLPTYETIGIAAPLLLTVCRIFQGLSIGGEFTGSFTYLYEHAPPRKKGVWSCIADLGCTGGMILGSMLVALLHQLLTNEQFMQFGWRLPFLSGIGIAILSIYIRNKLPETQPFITQAEISTRKNPITVVFSEHAIQLLTTTFLVTINAFGFYILTVFLPTQTLSLDKLLKSDIYWFTSIMLIAMSFSIIFSAYLSDKLGRAKMLMIGYAGCILFAWPMMHSLMQENFLTQCIYMMLFAIALGFCFGPRASFLGDSIPTHIRFSTSSISLNVGNALFGGTAPIIATLLMSYDHYGPVRVAFLIMTASAISLIAMLFLNNKFQKNNSYAYHDSY